MDVKINYINEKYTEDEIYCLNDDEKITIFIAVVRIILKIMKNLQVINLENVD